MATAEPETEAIPPLLHPPPQPEHWLEAAKSNDKESVSRLLERPDADINIRNADGLTALHLAILRHDTRAARVLLHNEADVEAPTPDRGRPLFMAVETSQTEILEDLLNRGANPHAGARGLGPLHAATSPQVVRLLLGHDTKTSSTSTASAGALLVAVDKGNAAAVKVLLDGGIHPDSCFPPGSVPALHTASEKGYVKIVDLLLKARAEVDRLDASGSTPLARAVKAGNLNTASLLLDHGASTRITWEGKSLRELASKNGDVADLIQRTKARRGAKRSEDESLRPREVVSENQGPPAMIEKDYDRVVACRGFEAIKTDFYDTQDEQKTPTVNHVSIHELLYSSGPGSFWSRSKTNNKPSFTWYHLPANNTVWVEGLVRRLAMENRGISAEAYDKIKAELGIFEPLIGRTSRPAAADFWPTGAHCRTVKIPFLHFEVFEKHDEMLKAVKRAREPNASSVSPNASSVPSNASSVPRDSTQTRNFWESNRGTGPEPAQSRGSSQTTSSHFQATDWKTRMKSAFMWVDQKLRDWRAGKPTSPRTPPSEHDVEQQSGHHTNSVGDPREEHSDDRPERRLSVAGDAADELRPRSGSSNSGAETRELSRRVTTTQGEGSREAQSTSIPEPELEPELIQEQRLDQDEPPRQTQDPSGIDDQSRISRQSPHPPPGNLSDYLVRGYSAPEKQGLELRRTLDQYTYAGVDTTSHRDDDQVIYRYTEDRSKGPPKIFMVDHMWLWVLGRDTIITSFPLRWDPWLDTAAEKAEQTESEALDRSEAVVGSLPPQPALVRPAQGHSALVPGISRAEPAPGDAGASQIQAQPSRTTPKAWPKVKPDDPLNVCELVTKKLQKSGGAVKSVHELAGLITTCCVDLFDTHRAPEEYRFFDFFERAINSVNDTVADRFRTFEGKVKDFRDEKGSDNLLDISKEIGHMIEIDDVFDELRTLESVLREQETVVDELNLALRGASGSRGRRVNYVKTKTLLSHLRRIGQMEKTAGKAVKSLNRLMDLNQKQSSLVEAWFSRKSATEAATQGRTVTVFTVVTIIFLPLTSIAAIFSIDTDAFPRDKDDLIPFNYVMRHILSIGFALSIVLILVAFHVDRITGWMTSIRTSVRSRWRWGVRAGTIIVVFLAVLVPILTSEVSGGIKAAVSIFVAVVALAGVLFSYIPHRVRVGRQSFVADEGEVDDNDSGESEADNSDADDSDEGVDESDMDDLEVDWSADESDVDFIVP